MGNFTRAELTQYLTTLTGLATPPPALIDKLYAHTEGNPLFVTEVIKQLIAQRIVVDAQGRWKATTFEDLGCEFQQVHVPPTVEAIVAHEYARLPPPQQALMAALAVWGQPATVTVLTALLDLPSPLDSSSPVGGRAGEGGSASLRPTLATLVQHGLLSYDPGTRTYTFRNATKQRGIYQQLGAKERQRLHARAAACCRDDPDCPLETRYAHEAQAGGGAPAEHALWALARHHLEVHRPRDAIEALHQLLQLQSSLPPGGGGVGRGAGSEQRGSFEARRLLAHAYQAAREYAKARELYTQLRAEVLQSTPSPLRGEGRGEGEQTPLSSTTTRCAALEEALGAIAMKTQAYTDAEQWFMQALSHYPPDDPVHRLRCDNALGQSQLYRGAITEAIIRFTNAAEAAKDLPPDERRRITNNELGRAYYQANRHAEAITQWENDCRFYTEIGETPHAMRVQYGLGQAHQALGHREEATAAYTQTLQLAKQCNDTEFLVNGYTGLGNLANEAGNNTEAIQYYERALDLSGRMGDDERTVGIAINLGDLCLKQHRFQRAEGHLLSAIAFLEQGNTAGGLVEYYRCAAHLKLAELHRQRTQCVLAHHHLERASTLATQHKACAALQPWITLTHAQLLRDEHHPKDAHHLLQTITPPPGDKTFQRELEATEKSLLE